MTITKTKLLGRFLTDDQILDCLILWQTRKMDAAHLLQSYLSKKWQIATLEAVNFLKAIEQEMSENDN